MKYTKQDLAISGTTTADELIDYATAKLQVRDLASAVERDQRLSAQ